MSTFSRMHMTSLWLTPWEEVSHYKLVSLLYSYAITNKHKHQHGVAFLGSFMLTWSRARKPTRWELGELCPSPLLGYFTVAQHFTVIFTFLKILGSHTKKQISDVQQVVLYILLQLSFISLRKHLKDVKILIPHLLICYEIRNSKWQELSTGIPL